MRVVFILAFILFTSNAFSRERSNAFLYARRNGAKANIKLNVVDDEHKPVPFVKVQVFMGMNFRERGYSIVGTTDANGMFVIDGTTTGNEIEVHLSKLGYYDSNKKLCFIGIGSEHDVKDGKWQPYGEVLHIALNRQRNPISMSCTFSKKFVLTRVVNKWIGFDLNMHDFITPYGKGETSDFEVFFSWDGEWYPKYKGMDLNIRFLKPFAGYCSYKKNEVSDFKGPYEAQENAKYVQNANFFERITLKKERERKLFDKDECWVVRSRCKVDERGKLVSAHYSVLYDIGFCCEEDGSVGLNILGAFNPVANDINLEYDVLCRQYERFSRDK